MDGNKIKKIIKSRVADKKDFYYDRLEKCLSCEFWSLNKGESKGLLYEMASFGKGHCTVCGCGEHKLRLAEESCPKGFWAAVKEQEKVDFGTYTVKNLSPEKSNVQKQGTFLLLDYGNIEYATDSKVDLEFDFGKIKNPTVGKSCGCTTPTLKKNNDGTYNVTIEYDTRRFGEIQNKKVWINYYKGSLKYRVNILLKGNIIKTS